jgi:inosine-uridine nucleoside N-ribohydrolase
MTKRKFFIDTDTASDDAVALLMALETPDVEVLGVSIVSGNMPVEQGSINARYTIELCKKDTSVYVGYDKPMVKKREHADWFHGPDGMGNMNYPDPKSSENKSDYKEVLNTLINQYPNEITVVTLGPLTNLGQFVLEYPESYQTAKGDFAIDCNKHALDSSQNWLGDPGLGLPDPVAMAVALNKKVVLKAGRHNVKIVLDGPARGMTIVDELNVGESEPHIDENWSHTTKNINVIWEINNQEWKETLYKTLKN